MPAIPTVNITVQDNGASAALSVPQQNIQVKIGCAVGGTVNAPFATSSPQSLQAQFIGGPLVEAGGLVCAQGNVCVAISCPIVTKGTATSVVATVPNGSTSVVTTTLDSVNGAWDQYYVMVKCVTGGTTGTAGIYVQVSLDAGRNFGPPIALGTAFTLTLGSPYSPTPQVGGTGIQLNFSSGTMQAGDFWRFSTIAPAWNDAGVIAALNAFQLSQYAVAGVGSMHIVGVCGVGDITAFFTTIQGQTSQYLYNRAIVELRDAGFTSGGGTAWGGSIETESAWITSLATAMGGASAQPRIAADGGYYNMPSPYASPAGGQPAYRRPLAWAHALKRTQIPLQRRAGRVKDGPYASIAVNPAVDPTDGFVYHDERVNQGLNAARIGSAMTWPKKGAGFYQCQEPLLSAPGSQFTELVIGNALDVACNIGYAAGVNEVSDDLKLAANGTLDPVDAQKLQQDIQVPLNQGMVQNSLVSSVTATVNTTANVATSGIIPVTISVLPRGYVNAINETISLTTGIAGTGPH